MRGRFCGTKPGAERQAAVSRLPPLSAPLPPVFLPAGKKKVRFAQFFPGIHFATEKRKRRFHTGTMSKFDGPFVPSGSKPVLSFVLGFAGNP